MDQGAAQWRVPPKRPRRGKRNSPAPIIEDVTFFLADEDSPEARRRGFDAGRWEPSRRFTLPTGERFIVPAEAEPPLRRTPDAKECTQLVAKFRAEHPEIRSGRAQYQRYAQAMQRDPALPNIPRKYFTTTHAKRGRLPIGRKRRR